MNILIVSEKDGVPIVRYLIFGSSRISSNDPHNYAMRTWDDAEIDYDQVNVYHVVQGKPLKTLGIFPIATTVILYE